MTDNKDTLLLTVPQLAKQLQIGRDTAYSLCHVKDFPAVRIGRTIRINSESLQKWLDKQNGGNLL